MTPEQAQALFDQGKITQATLDSVLASQPSFDAPLDTSLTVSPVNVGGTVPALDTVTPTEAPPELAPLPPVTQEAIPEAAPVPQTPVEAPLATPSVTTTTTTQKRATDEARAAQDQITSALEAQKDALEEQTQIGAAKAAETFGFNQEAQRIEAEAAQAEQDLRNQGAAEIEKRINELDSRTAELSDRKYEGYWASKSTGEKIVGAISLALGAYASALGGGPNAALKIINGAMNEDFKAFQANTKIKMDAINRSRLGIEDKRRLLSDQIINLQAKKLSDISIVQSKINNLGNKFKDEELKAKLAGLNAQLDQQAAETRAKFENSLAETVNTKVTEQQALATGIDKELYVPGLGQALTKQDAKELKKAFITKQDLDVKLKEIIALRTKHDGGEMFDREDVARGKQLSKELLLKYKDLAKLGVLSESDMAIIEEIIPADPLQFDFMPGQEPTMEKLTSLQKDINGLFEAEVEARLEPGTRITQFPITVTKDGQMATVSNEAELSEAMTEGWTR